MNYNLGKKFCVIGDKSQYSYPVKRTWFESQLEAEAHAARLIHENKDLTKGCPTLLIVEVVSAIQKEKPLPPPVKRLNHEELQDLLQRL